MEHAGAHGSCWIIARYLDLSSFASPIAIRQNNIAYDHIFYSPRYPRFKVTDTLGRNGFNGNFYGIAPTGLIPTLLSTKHLQDYLDNLPSEYDAEELREYCSRHFDPLCNMQGL